MRSQKHTTEGPKRQRTSHSNFERDKSDTNKAVFKWLRPQLSKITPWCCVQLATSHLMCTSAPHIRRSGAEPCVQVSDPARRTQG